MEIRRSGWADYDEIRRVYAYARDFMKRTGNPTQWGDTSPAPALIEGDFENGTGYVVLEEGRIVGAFAFIVGEDPTYREIEDGAWLNDEPYGTIHRIATDGTVHGVTDEAIRFCSRLVGNIRIDTHEDNKVMQRVIARNGFTRCGIIYIADGTPRIAYQKVVR